METSEDVYMVLPSNSSMAYFPENSTCSFTTHLQREIELHDEWLVGLVEIHIPCSTVHFQDNEASYTFHTTEEDERLIDKKVCRIPAGIYDSLEELVEVMNSANGTYRHQMLKPLKNRKGSIIMRRICNCPQIYITDFNEKIRRVFGFDEAGQKRSFTTFNEGFRNIAASSPASLSRALPDQMYVYTDICEPYTVDETQAALLRIVSIENSSFKLGQQIRLF